MADEIANANAETEKAKKDEDQYYDYYTFGRLRYDLLPLVAAHDAELALALLIQTRPASVAAALSPSDPANGGQNTTGREGKTDSAIARTVREENDLEQRLVFLAAEQNPERAIKLIRESLAKGVSRNILGMLRKLNEKDEKKAAALAGEVIDKIAGTDLAKDQSSIAAAFFIVYDDQNQTNSKSPATKRFAFTASQILTVAEKLADFLLQTEINAAALPLELPMMMSVLEKIVPNKVARFKQKLTAAPPDVQPKIERMRREQKVFDNNSTPEEVLAEILQMKESERAGRNYYSILSDRIAGIEDEARAKKLLEKIPDEAARARTLERFEAAKARRAEQSGDLDTARKLIENLREKKTRIQRSVALTVEFYRKGTEKDRATAAGLMKDAKALISEYPDDEDERNDLMEVVMGYAVIEPDEAFRLFAPIIEQINDFVQASAILSKYDKGIRGFRRGELVMKSADRDGDSLLIYRYISQMKMLAKADLEKMRSQLDRFQRPDARSILQLYVARSFLNESENKNRSSERQIFGFV